MLYYEQVNLAMNPGVSLRQIQALPTRAAIGRMKEAVHLETIRSAALVRLVIKATALEVEK